MVEATSLFLLHLESGFLFWAAVMASVLVEICHRLIIMATGMLCGELISLLPVAASGTLFLW
jgi:hypothetical protein